MIYHFDIVFNCERAGVSTLAHILTRFHNGNNSKIKKQWKEKHARNAISLKKKQCSANQPPGRLGWPYIVKCAKTHNGKNVMKKRNAIQCLVLFKQITCQKKLIIPVTCPRIWNGSKFNIHRPTKTGII